jgi:hypothetical protein
MTDNTMSRPNLLREPITKEDIQEYLASADDFQLEIDVFRACLEAGLSAEHGGTYKDPKTRVDRQFDIRAKYEANGCFVRLAIECKALAEFFPLVVSRVPRRPAESSYHAIVSARSSCGSRFSIERMPQGLFKTGAPVGKATFQLGRKDQKVQPPHKQSLHTGDSEVYEKWAQAIASAHDLVSRALTDAERAPGKCALSWVLPVLVVADKTLWTVNYNELGIVDGDPIEVDECSIFLNTSIDVNGPGFPVSYPLSHLLVYTKSGLIKMLKSLADLGTVREAFICKHDDVRDMALSKFGDYFTLQ